MTDGLTLNQLAERNALLVSEVEQLNKKLLAYEQAAPAQPVALIFENHAFTELYKLEEIEIAQRTQKEAGGTITELFKGMPARSVIPKQPVMFIDGDISSDDAEKLAAVIREFGNEQPVPIHDENGLLPCPFCSGKAKKITIENESDPCFGGDVITCMDCGASSHVEYGFKENLESSWNSRENTAPAQPALVESLKKVMNSWLAMEPKLAYQPEFTDVMMLLDAEAAPAQPAIQEQAVPVAYTDNRNLKSLQKKGCATALLWLERNSEVGDIPLYTEVPAQQNEPQNIPENIPAHPVIPEQALSEFNNGLGAMMLQMAKQLEIMAKQPDDAGKMYVGVMCIQGVCDLLYTAHRMISAQPVSEPYQAVNDIIAERQRQIREEGWTPEHDDKYNDFQLALAAAGYAQNVADYAGEYCQPNSSIDWTDAPEPEAWPWSPVWWKPSNPRRDLVKAGALILAEIERLDRAAPAQESE